MTWSTDCVRLILVALIDSGIQAFRFWISIGLLHLLWMLFFNAHIFFGLFWYTYDSVRPAFRFEFLISICNFKILSIQVCPPHQICMLMILLSIWKRSMKLGHTKKWLDYLYFLIFFCTSLSMFLWSCKYTTNSGKTSFCAQYMCVIKVSKLSLFLPVTI